MATLERAIQIAAKAHAGIKDKGGEPYILHPLRIMLRMSTQEERIVAVLHDVVEDTEFKLASLQSEGFAPEIIAAIDALTKRSGEKRTEAARRAAADPIARKVKLEDNADNMDLRRIPNPTDQDWRRFKEYVEVRAILKGDAA